MRDILASIPAGAITPTQRYALTIINTYSDDTKINGACWIGHERLSKELGVRTRGLMKILHELGDGSIVDKDRIRPCNKGCKRHLGVLNKHLKRVLVGTRQSYSINWQSLEQLSSMYQSAHLNLEKPYSGDLECELEAQKVGTSVHTYKHNKNNKNLKNWDFISNDFLKAIPYSQRLKINDYLIIDQLVSEYFERGGRGFQLVELVNNQNWREIRMPRHFIEKRLLPNAISSFRETPTPPPFRETETP